VTADVVRIDWNEAEGPARVREVLAAHGLAWIRIGAVAEEARAAPWAFAERLLGTRPLLVERQPIRPIANGRSYASGTMEAPFHTDSQCALGVPAAVQVMVCVQPARLGGECLFLDTWPLVERIACEDPALAEALFAETRTQPFVFGAVCGPTVARRGGHLVFTHSAVADDVLARRLRPYVASAPVVALAPEAGDVIVASNHRMLHGRRAFTDTSREFVRLLVWPRDPLPAPAALAARARDVGEGAAWSEEGRQRLEVTLALLRATPAGILSAREGVPEERLYRWRDRALRAMLDALGDDGPDGR
jgi:gamma-butyrobetaine dioxygenase